MPQPRTRTVCPAFSPASLCASDDAGQRLDEGALIVGNGFGQQIGPLLDQDLGDEDVFGEAAAGAAP